jgi:hypothetical protein
LRGIKHLAGVAVIAQPVHHQDIARAQQAQRVVQHRRIGARNGNGDGGAAGERNAQQGAGPSRRSIAPDRRSPQLSHEFARQNKARV